jgi:hypothetical protein
VDGAVDLDNARFDVEGTKSNPMWDFAKVIAQAVGEDRRGLKRALEGVREFMNDHGTHVSLLFDFANFVLHMIGLILGRIGGAARGFELHGLLVCWLYD